jgi:single-strand DNA-binding protein
MQINDVKVVGNLTREPELRATPNGTPVANVSLGVNETHTVDGGERKTVTTFVDVQVWGAAAENLAKLAQKGQEIYVQGPLCQEQWVDKQTKKSRSRLFVKAESWQFTQYKMTEQMRQAAQTRQSEMTR